MKPDQIIKKILGEEALNLWRALLKQKPKTAQAIVFLQGDRLDRVPTTLDLYKRGLAKKILITGNNDLIGRGKRNDENDIHLDKIKEVFLKNGVPIKSLIIDDRAFNTKDQAVNTIKTALKKEWRVILVVTSPYHILRAYLTFVRQALEQKWSGEIIMCKDHLNWLQIPSGRSKNTLEMLTIELEKIKKYQPNISSLKEGLDYLNK
jgi:uncharacterized SAM-binding protein YcdF (DUF218 family)